MPVLKDRRFRDMRLTEEEVLAMVERRCHRKPWYFPGCDVANEEWRLFDRAKRLLPLWRDWGLRDAEEEIFLGVGHMIAADYSKARFELLKKREKRRKP